MQKVMKMISGKSSSLMSPSPLSSSRLTTAGAMVFWDELGNGLPTAFGLAMPRPPHWISIVGGTAANGSGGSEQVGAAPVPTHTPTSQAAYAGQSQSSS